MSLISMMYRRTCISVIFLTSSAVARTRVDGITQCRTGSKDLFSGNNKVDKPVFTVQVCNLFGATCFMNHVELASTNCETHALMVEHQQCALFPILSYSNYDRTDPAKLLVGQSGCSTSCNNAGCEFTGGCVSVQCSLGGDPVKYAAPAKSSGLLSARGKVTDTGSATFQVHNFVELAVSGSKTVLLSRTGNYVGSYKQAGSNSGTAGVNAYNYGQLPTIRGNNYGPAGCPAANTLASNAGVSKEFMRMCGNTAEWVYFGAANLLMDKTMVGKMSGDTVGTTNNKIGFNENLPFLGGGSQYRSGKQIPFSREVYLFETATASEPLMTSAILTPGDSQIFEDTDAMKEKSHGTWRFYSVVFYCDAHDRVNLEVCPADNRKIFYVADPNPAPQYGLTVGAIAGEEKKVSGAVTLSGASLAAFATFAVVLLGAV